MPTEIERKFLLKNDAWRRDADEPLECRQGYLARTGALGARVRVMGERGFLTIKSDRRGFTRLEYEYEIPRAHAAEMLDRLPPEELIEKTRWRARVDGATWVIDVFRGRNEGLVLAEIELDSEEGEFTRPDWLGEEVTRDPRYTNSYLARRPYRSWDD